MADWQGVDLRRAICETFDITMAEFEEFERTHPMARADCERREREAEFRRRLPVESGRDGRWP